MSAIDELRRLLVERGVEYRSYYLNTSWYVGMKLYMATDDKNGTLTMDNLTPEQAIAATLESGTCENIAPDYLDFLCSKCGFVHYHSDENDTGDGNDWNYCPKCGCKVVSNGERK